MDRRELFTSFSSILKKDKKESYVRPPYVLNSSLFNQLCSNCEGKCASFCEEKIIKISKNKTPYLDFTISGCTYCEKCFSVCEILTNKDEKIKAKIEINLLKCLSWNNTMCFSCKDVCLDNAINFLGLFRPEITNKCTNCGFCIKVCPTEAIVAKA